ncbi:MAG TPA: hypothetical protein VIJ84_09140 [Gaiellaceae bacterium]
MSNRDEIIAYLGLPTGATFSEIEHAYIVRCNSAAERLAAGDESARVELAALKDAFGRLSGRGDIRGVDPGAQGSAAALGETHLRAPLWWECYLSLLLALASVAALAILAAYLPHLYHKGGFVIPLALIVAAGLLSIFASMLAEADLRQGRRARILRRRGIDGGGRSARVRFQAARAATFLGRAVRWLIVPALIATLFLNFASLSGHWSIRK